MKRRSHAAPFAKGYDEAATTTRGAEGQARTRQSSSRRLGCGQQTALEPRRGEASRVAFESPKQYVKLLEQPGNRVAVGSAHPSASLWGNSWQPGS
eukprot:6190476-Pleurochrysis_carterae.AAC.1